LRGGHENLNEFAIIVTTRSCGRQSKEARSARSRLDEALAHEIRQHAAPRCEAQIPSSGLLDQPIGSEALDGLGKEGPGQSAERLPEALRREAGAAAKSQEDGFAPGRRRIVDLGLDGGRLALGDRLQVVAQAAGVSTARAVGGPLALGIRRPGTDSETEHGLPAPVALIVGGLVPRSRVVGQLVALDSHGEQLSVEGLDHVRRPIGVGPGELPPAIGQGEGGALLHHQLVGGDVLGAEGCDRTKIGLEPSQALPRSRKDEVDREIREPRLASRREGAAPLFGLVGPAEPSQDGVVEGLDSDGEPIDARFAKGRQPLPFDGARIDLQRELESRGTAGELRLDRLDDARHRLGPQQGRRPPSEIEARERKALEGRGSKLELRSESANVSILHLRADSAADDREVAVGTDAIAERNVDVDADAVLAHGGRIAPAHRGGGSCYVRPMAGSDVYHEVLPNGLTLLLREAQLAPVASLQIWAKVGSADERPGEQGLAHFHEHMLFKGTEQRGVGAVAGDVEAAGGRINAYTTFDTTVYYATMPSESVMTGLDVLVDAVRNSRFDPDEIHREREVVLEEIRRAEDSPGHVLSDAVFGTAYQEHPYGAPILGPPEGVARFERDQVRSFFERWYAPDNLVIVAAGDFEATALADHIRTLFADAEPRGTQRDRPAEPDQSEPRTAILCRPFEGVRVDLAWRTACFADPDTPLLDLLSFILGECESSRLVRRVKDDDQLVDRIDSSSYTPLDAGLFSVSFEADAPRVKDAVESVLREIERLRTELVSLDELERARTNFLANEHYERESVTGMASRLGSFHVLAGDYRGDAAYLETIRNARPAELLRVARHYLDPERVNVAAVLPEADASALDEDSIRDRIDRGVATTRRRFARPSRTPVAEGSPVHSYELSNGASLHVVPRRDVPVVAARAAFLGGLLTEDEQSAGISSFLASIWTRGTRTRSAVDFARAVENLAGEINGFSGRSSIGFTLDATSDKFEPVLDLFAEALLEPGFHAEEIDRERRETLAAIERQADRLAQLAYLQLSEMLFPTHPYRLPMLGSESSVARIDAEALRALHERTIRPENLVFAVAGDVDPDAIAEAIAFRTSDLSARGFTAPSPPLDSPPSEIQERRLRKDRAQAHLALGFAGLTVQDPDRYALDVLSQILAGQGGRLFLELRDKQSLAYSVSSMNVEGVAPGFFSVYIATAPDKLEKAQRGMLDELEQLVETAPSKEELARARRYLTGSAAIDGQRNSNHAAHIALDTLYGLGAGSHYAYASRIAEVSAADVLRVARRVLRLDAYALSLVGDV
jgi:zinc protease